MKRGSSGIHALIGVNKAPHMTSHDVISHLRRSFQEKRIGHAGTLDPLAEGVLVVGIGQATRLLSFLTSDVKRYRARVVFGASTTTDDAEGEIVGTADVSPDLLDESFASEQLASLIGKQLQVPPRFSAISTDGQRAYKRARTGEDFELTAREIEVIGAQLISYGEQSLIQNKTKCPYWDIDFIVSKGTYIRALARDLGVRMGCGAYLGSLVRTQSGTVDLRSCFSLEEIDDTLRASQGFDLFLDPTHLLPYTTCELSREELAAVQTGRAFAVSGLTAGERISLLKEDKLYGVWEFDGIKLHSRATFPEGIEGVGSFE